MYKFIKIISFSVVFDIVRKVVFFSIEQKRKKNVKMISFQKITNFPSKILHTSRSIIVFKFLVRYVLSSGKKIHENVLPFLFSFRISSKMYVFFKPKVYSAISLWSRSLFVCVSRKTERLTGRRVVAT